MVRDAAEILEEMSKPTDARRRREFPSLGLAVADSASRNLRNPKANEEVDDEKEIVGVTGHREMPWAWRLRTPIAEVKVVIGKKLALRGEDYEVDEVAGIVRFLKKEHCRSGVHYYIREQYREEPVKYGSVMMSLRK